MLDIRNLTVRNEDIFLLKNVTLRADNKEWHAIAGPSGAGKSLTAHAICSLVPKSIEQISGSVMFRGNNLVKMKKKSLDALASRSIAYIFQDPRHFFFPYLSIYKQWDDMVKIQYPKLSKKERKIEMLEALHAVKLPDNVLKSYPSELSGGQIQRVALAAVWLMKPNLIIADEPTSALDALTSQHIMQLFQTLREEIECTILMISHDLREVFHYADTVSILADGRIIEQGNTASVLLSPQSALTKQLCRAVPSLYRPKMEEDLLKPLFSMKNVHYVYPKTKKGVKDISFSLYPGECVGIVGESGSGKSTIVQLCLYLLQAQKGVIEMKGKSLKKLSAKERRFYRQKTQAVLQHNQRSFIPRQKVSRTFLEPVRNIPVKERQLLTQNHEREFAESWMSLVGLCPTVLDRKPETLSGGQQQRVHIARALSINPSFLVLDEPTSNLDVLSQATVLELLQQKTGDSERGTLFIGHDISVVDKLAERFIVMKEGEIVDTFHKNNMWSQTRHSYTKLLLKASTWEGLA
ncbi:ABC transporter ATP-binding protein [Alteribacillus bidgolensis]|uniref:Peptide/nickel transport system ATP-binding protein/oligopeptide transport system ATP-binding protein n=1 Tax=Alteribacillus bidgolensis TaxID=930129 RepID=A0A1G8FYY7_9BACI|nr:ATP-binding cassette domain-containing protein [Alteribacillus bidgolensis]SDH87290.1 peptide/nickel transport system ATP-binding protein/oligopeptide transport system ATP-binding protein [Alteribacillus bidgolensis]